jgi:hypothetical protein
MTESDRARHDNHGPEARYAVEREVARGLELGLPRADSILDSGCHGDTRETSRHERMRTTSWFHATDLPNVPPRNLVQIGIGGWQAPRPGVRVGRRITSLIAMPVIYDTPGRLLRAGYLPRRQNG